MKKTSQDKPIDFDFGETLTTEDGSLTMVNPEIDEAYHSTAGASFEARELYLNSSGYLDYLSSSRDDRVAVLDIGLGLGYNALSTWEAWSKSAFPGDLEILSLEKDPALVEALASGKAPWQRGEGDASGAWSEDWLRIASGLFVAGANVAGAGAGDGEAGRGGCWTWSGNQAAGRRRFTWRVLVGDAARRTLPMPKSGYWRYFWQDAFSPVKNSELWTAEWFRGLRAVAGPESTLVTYSCARAVKDALSASGWSWRRIGAPGQGRGGRKKHWLLASPDI